MTLLSAAWRPLLAATLLAVVAACAAPDPDRELRQIRRWEDLRTTADDSLSSYLSHGSTAVRAAAARALGRVGDPSAVDRLLRTLADDGAALVRAEAAFALGLVGHRDAVEGLAARLDRETDLQTLGEVVLALGRIGQVGSASLLHRMLESPYVPVRENAAEALALLADSNSVAVLMQALDDPVESVAWRAAYALEKIPGQRQVPPLMGLLESSSVELRRAAVRTLGRLEAATAGPARRSTARAHRGRPGPHRGRIDYGRGGEPSRGRQLPRTRSGAPGGGPHGSALAAAARAQGAAGPLGERSHGRLRHLRRAPG